MAIELRVAAKGRTLGDRLAHALVLHQLDDGGQDGCPLGLASAGVDAKDVRLGSRGGAARNEGNQSKQDDEREVEALAHRWILSGTGPAKSWFPRAEGWPRGGVEHNPVRARPVLYGEKTWRAWGETQVRPVVTVGGHKAARPAPPCRQQVRTRAVLQR